MDFLADTMEDIFHHRSEAQRGAFVWDLSTQAEELLKQGETKRILAEGGFHEGKAEMSGRFMSEAACSTWNTDLKRWVTESPLPEVVAQLLRTERLKFLAV